MAKRRSAKSAAIGKVGTRSFGYAINIQNAIRFRKKVDGDVRANATMKSGLDERKTKDGFKELFLGLNYSAVKIRKGRKWT